VDHGGHVRHQESAGKPCRRARQGGDPIQIGIAESDFESISGSRNTLLLN
jgi:hypothetical protein